MVVPRFVGLYRVGSSVVRDREAIEAEGDTIPIAERVSFRDSAPEYLEPAPCRCGRCCAILLDNWAIRRPAAVEDGDDGGSGLGLRAALRGLLNGRRRHAEMRWCTPLCADPCRRMHGEKRDADRARRVVAESAGVVSVGSTARCILGNVR